MALQKPVLKFHPAFSDASSATEYTSSESDEEDEATTQKDAEHSQPLRITPEKVLIILADSDDEMHVEAQVQAPKVDPDEEMHVEAQVQTPKVDSNDEMHVEAQVQTPKVDSDEEMHVEAQVQTPKVDLVVEKKELVEGQGSDGGEDEASTVSGNYKYPILEEVFPPDWSRGVICDLCQRGPSLAYGAWHSWCCGKPSKGCNCSHEDQQQKRKALTGRRDKNPSANVNLAHVWSGKVHKHCALWSAEVYQNSKEPWIMMELENAMRRSRKLKCSECGRVGATLGCRVKSCKKTYHYPCADRLSAFVKVSMWEGFVKPIACKYHRHEEVKQKKRKRGKFGTPQKTLVYEGASDHEEEANPVGLDSPVSVSRTCAGFPPPIGKNVLTPDFSYGCEESVPVPCTNDIDGEGPPYMEYITKTRFRNYSLGSKDCPQPPPERLAKACKGCTHHDLDDPSAPLSIHVPFKRREDDDREDWMEDRMYGRLPYDQYGRLLIGIKFNELVECNERCKCGELCRNRELQKGLTTPVELFKTENKGWALRTLVAIPRGKFVVEYVGEMMTQEQFLKYGKNTDSIETQRSYTQELDYPESKRTPDFLLDSFHASNVSRFINHSCNPNMKLYRVYVETTYKWLPHIGFYAIRDIEAGEELVHDYNFGRNDIEGDALENKGSTHVKCYCGAKDCRKLLLVHTEEDG